ncbi:MAG TPA: protein translocase subunit SecD [Kiritimatiellia bacterium]|nr:protein translocase subunit SecD [Kiritimatiellia bacterium]HRZ11837.1 protein translocase subunit SecD [Kiritimatiellia bacterium]HSA17357.1 protein translocase subunit SecD [Kiritimatiellia bacterium]
MDKHSLWKWLVLIGLVAWSMVLVMPLHEKVKLGLDLRGGMSFVLEVDTTTLAPDAISDAQARALEVIRGRVDAMGVAEPIIYPEPGNNRIVVQMPGLGAEDRDRAVRNIQSAAFLEFRMVHPKNDDLVEDLFDQKLVPDGYKIVSIDEQMPSGQWKAVNYYKRDVSLDTPGTTDREVRDRLKLFKPQSNYDFMLMKEIRNGQELFQPYYVRRLAELKGEDLIRAGVDFRPPLNQPIVTLKFDAKGSRRFAKLTSDYAPGGQLNPGMDSRRYLAIVFDGQLRSAPFIKTAIHGGEAIIEGSFSVKEAQDLSIVLRAGALPAPVKVMEERRVDPSLGSDSINSGKRAAIYGGIGVVVFMCIYYLGAGLVANLALVLNLVLLPFGMWLVAGFFSILETRGLGGGGMISLPTLTLPGLAGIVLTAGMAVDANVLIFERIREEQAAGKRFAAAIPAGYDKAFSAILDSNLTTLLVAIILFWQGSGPVRGYAVTLSAGIVVSMYTAITVTRMIFTTLAQRFDIGSMKMLQFFKSTKINFLRWRFVAGGLSLTIIIVTWVLFVLRGQDNFGVDFTGGSSITFQFEEKRPEETIRQLLESEGIEDPFIQYQRLVTAESGGTEVEYLEVKTPFADGDKTASVITEKLADAKYSVLKQDSIGPQIGQELKRKGLKALILSFIVMIIYVSWRFEFGYAIGALLALVHDVLVTVGIYTLLGRQLSVTTLAAVLTIVGYSVNDTIVIFDRIREQLKLNRGMKYADVANMSINQTLSRTVLTSGTTMITVLALLLLGGGAINDFALVMFIGMIAGTYSTIYMATPIALLWHREKPREDEKKA